MEHGEVGVGAFLPADEDATEAVEPGVRSLDDPAAGAEACFPLDRLCFFAAAADVGGERELLGQVAYLVEVVAAIGLCAWSGVGFGRSIGIDSIVSRASLKSFRFAPAGAIPSGTPLPSVRSDRFALF